MDLRMLSGNIRRLRDLRGISQSKLAKAAGVSLPAIKNLEASKHEPRMNTVEALADALGVQLPELFLPVRELKTVRFRSAKQLKNRDSFLIAASRWLDDFNFLEETLNECIPFKLQGMPCKRNDIAACATACRKHLGLKDTEPIRDICGLLESAGAKVYLLSAASEGFFGLSIGQKDNGPAIVVNIWDRITVERQIFSAAHELGHLLLHPHAFDASQTKEDKTEEKEANEFAGHFLMPNKGFLKEWNEASGLNPVERVLKIKRMYHVSYKTILYRLIENGLATEAVWKKFNIAYSRQYPGRSLAHKAEPFPMARIEFSEDRLSGLVRKALEKEKISMSRAAEILKTSVSSMREIKNQWESAL